MKPTLLITLILLAVIGLLPPAAAQDDTPPVPLTGTWTYTELVREANCGYVSGTTTLADQEGNEDFESEFSLYVLGDGQRLLLVFSGDDFLYTMTDPGVYEGTLVKANPDETYEATLSVTDEDTLRVSAVYSLGLDCTFTYQNAYALVDETPAQLWSESARTLTNASLAACLGQASVAETWLDNDPLVPVVFLDESPGTPDETDGPSGDTSDEPDTTSGTPDEWSGLHIGTDRYTLSGAGFEHVRAETVADSTHVFTTRLIPVDEDTFQVDFLYQIDGRDDCAIAYTSELRRVDDLAARLEEMK